MKDDINPVLQVQKVYMAGVELSQVCFGTEHITQAAPEFGGALLAEAMRLHGVNFWDTDNSYGSVTQVTEALKLVKREEVVIASKTYGESAEDARFDIKRTLAELNTSYVDLFLLHEVAAGSLHGKMPALAVLHEAKKAGIVKAVGLSTHSATVVSDAAELDGVEFLCAPLNMEGSRIDEGTLDAMLLALDKAHNKCGKGIYVIKTLGAGDLVRDVRGALEWVLQYQDRIDVYNIGVASLAEMRENLEILSRHIPMGKKEGVKSV